MAWQQAQGAQGSLRGLRSLGPDRLKSSESESAASVSQRRVRASQDSSSVLIAATSSWASGVSRPEEPPSLRSQLREMKRRGEKRGRDLPLPLPLPPLPPPPPHPMVSCLVWPCCFPRLVLFGLVPSPRSLWSFWLAPPRLWGAACSTEVWYGLLPLVSSNVIVTCLVPSPLCGVGPVVVLVGAAPAVWCSVLYRDMVWLLPLVSSNVIDTCSLPYKNVMLLFSPCKRCPFPCSDAVLRCEEALARNIHRGGGLGPESIYVHLCFCLNVVRGKVYACRGACPKRPLAALFIITSGFDCWIGPELAVRKDTLSLAVWQSL